MRRNCNLELRLVPPSVSHYSNDNHHQPPMMGVSEPGENQQLTIFYDGRVSFCDVTELQARAIILLASQQGVEEKSKSQGTSDEEPPAASPPLLMTSRRLPPPPAPGISMKRSLQRFLQKRRNRIQSTSPYQHH